MADHEIDSLMEAATPFATELARAIDRALGKSGKQMPALVILAGMRMVRNRQVMRLDAQKRNEIDRIEERLDEATIGPRGKSSMIVLE